MLNKNLLFLIFFLTSTKLYGETKCDNDTLVVEPCITINKTTPNSSNITQKSIKKYSINSSQIEEFGLISLNEALEMVPGLKLNQSGPTGQQTSLFTRGTGSNHTLVLLNGIPINDQSTTQGLHDFGVDFTGTLSQVDVYLGPNGVHFGPGAIGGAINLLTTIDFSNSIEISGNDSKNKNFFINYTNVTNDGWTLNYKSNFNKSKKTSAIYNGIEKDGVNNIGANINIEKWIDDNSKFRSVIFARETFAEYDQSINEEIGFNGNNLMYAFQFGFDRKNKNLNDYITFHYNAYDRDYNESGVIDEYISRSYLVKTERQVNVDEKISYGLGTEYKYDIGEFQNRGSYAASTKGNIYNSSIFANLGLRPFKQTYVSYFSRFDNHETTGLNNANKINITNFLKKSKISLTYSTGFRNPSLYELYGTDNYGYAGNPSLKAEESNSYEISNEYRFNKNISFELIGFKSNISNYIEYKNNTYVNGSNQSELNQSGIESNFKIKTEKYNLFTYYNLLSSKNTNGEDQLRRPKKTYGFVFEKKLKQNHNDNIKFLLKYQHYGESLDTHSLNWNTILMEPIDIMDFSIIKKKQKIDWFINFNNLLNENYQLPHGYGHERRQIKIGFKKRFL